MEFMVGARIKANQTFSESLAQNKTIASFDAYAVVRAMAMYAQFQEDPSAVELGELESLLVRAGTLPLEHNRYASAKEVADALTAVRLQIVADQAGAT